jgi:hypothetical protein
MPRNFRDRRTILVSCNPADETARRFAVFAREHGANIAYGSAGQVLSIVADRDGSAHVTLDGVDGAQIGGVWNRGFSDPDASDDPFLQAEWLAAWWSALALFRGRVINRPSLEGFFPNVDCLSLTRSVPGLSVRKVEIRTGSEPGNADTGPVNVHRISDGHFVGRLPGRLNLLDSEWYAFTPFNPSCVARILIAGDETFHLAMGSDRLQEQFADQILALRAELGRRCAHFCLLVLEARQETLHLLSASLFPHVTQYGHLENQVHLALLDYLSCDFCA